MAADSSAENLELGARLVDAAIDSDRRLSDLRWQLGLERLDAPTSSGLADADYPSAAAFGLDELAEFSVARQQPIPQELADQFNRMQCNCAMGLHAEISRAWVAVDSDLFMWNYETGSDLAYYDGLTTTILSVGVARPKRGVFAEHVHYLLCVATAVEAVVLAVTFTDRAGRPVSEGADVRAAEMNVLPEPLFRAPLDGVVVADVAASRDGRIFLAGRDGCLYELDYWDRGWFRRNCNKINHSKGFLNYLMPTAISQTFIDHDPLIQLVVDTTRHILFTLSEKGNVQVFDLGADGKSTSRTASLSAGAIQHQAVLVCNTVEPSNFSRVVRLCAVESSRSAALNAVGVTAAGARLYFSCARPADFAAPSAFAYDSTAPPPASLPDYSWRRTQQEQRPRTLRLVHARLPPGFGGSSHVPRPRAVHMAAVSEDATLLVSAVDDENDLLSGLSSAHFPFQQNLMETHMQLALRGRTWAVAESVGEWRSAVETTVAADSPDSVLPIRPHLVVRQHAEEPRRFVVLTAHGVSVIERQRPIDVLRRLLLDYGPDSAYVGSFFNLHTVDQACAMCLPLICSTTAQNQQVVAERALRAFFAYGGDPRLTFPADVAQSLPNGLSFRSPERTFADMHMCMLSCVGVAKANPSAPIGASTPQSPVIGQRAAMDTSSGFVRSPPNAASQWRVGAPQALVSDPFRAQVDASHMAPDVQYSHAHNAIYLYFGRLLGTLWLTGLTVASTSANSEPSSLTSAFTGDELMWFAEQLKDLRDFLGRESVIPAMSGQSVRSSEPNANIHQRLINFMRPSTVDSPSTARSQLSKKYYAEALAAERRSLLRLRELVEGAAEVLSLWKVLSDHQFHIVVSQLPADIQRVLRDASLRHIVVAGKTLCADLITCLIRQYLGDHATTDAISGRLRQLCPGLYSCDDAVIAKANELLQFARAADDDRQHADCAANALALYKRVADQLELATVCKQFQQLGNYNAVVELAVAAANKLDPQNLALAFYRNGGGADNAQWSAAYSVRQTCYSCISEALTSLNAASPNPLLSAQEAALVMQRLLDYAFSTDDELCHVFVFDWLVEHGRTKQLLQFDSAHLETYLHARLSNCAFADDQPLMDLLWQFYEKRGRYLHAAELLAKLAGRHSTRVPLKQRLAYLSQALMCAKSAPESATSGNELLRELEDKLEASERPFAVPSSSAALQVARLQSQVRSALESLRLRDRGYVREALARLDADLLDATQLYGDFAEQFGLPECKLAIVHCAGHSDAALVEALWREIAERQLAMSSNESAASRSRQLSAKLIDLSKLYASTPRYFPEDVLLEMLLLKAFESGFEPGWVGQTAVGMRLDRAALLRTLETAFKSEENPWRRNRRARGFLLRATEAVISEFVAAHSSLPLHERRQFASRAVDSIAYLLVELEAMPAGIAEFAAIRQQFQTLQLRLETVA